MLCAEQFVVAILDKPLYNRDNAFCQKGGLPYMFDPFLRVGIRLVVCNLFFMEYIERSGLSMCGK